MTSYLCGVLGRRWRRSTLIVTGLALASAGIIVLGSLNASLCDAEAIALQPLGGAATDLLVTDNTNSSSTSSASVEDAQRDLLDLSELGPPGTTFTHDFFLSTGSPLMPTDTLQQIRRVPSVASASGALTLLVSHRTGTVPIITAEFVTPRRTVTLSPPTAEEIQAEGQCLQSLGPAPNAEREMSCLPERFRRVVVSESTITTTIAPPETDFSTTAYTVAGVDVSNHALGVLTPGQIEQGRYFSSGSSPEEAVLSQAYARAHKLGVGSQLKINSSALTVVGVARAQSTGLTYDMYVPLATLQNLTGRHDGLSMIMVRARATAMVPSLVTQLRRRFPHTRVAAATSLANSVTGSLRDASAASQSYSSGLAFVLMVTGTLTCLAFSLASLGKRTGELGTLRAIGWTRRRLLVQIGVEMLSIAGVACVLGVALGTLGGVVAIHALPPLELRSIGGDLNASSGGYHVKVRLQPALTFVPLAEGLLVPLFGGGTVLPFVARRVLRLEPAAAMCMVD